VTTPVGSAGARILDRGYRSYEGPRRGRSGAVWSLTRHSLQRVLGLRRPAATKILPGLAAFIAYVPAIVFVGIAVLFDQVIARQPDVLPDYGDYYGFISAAIVVFTAFVAPEALCPDRRTSMLGLYLASPLTRLTYLLGKALAVGAALALVTLGPPLFLLVARTVSGSGPDGPTELASIFGKVVLAGVGVALLPAALSLAIAGTTTRKAAASAAIILVLVGSTVVSGALVEGADAAESFFLLNLLELPFELVQRIYGEGGDDPAVATIPTWQLVAAYLGWVSSFGAFVVLRYRRMSAIR
jgi:ABC-2 type transport system permease protein